MKEKSYFEVLEEMEGRAYDNFEIQLDLGEKCLKDIKALESSDITTRVQRIADVNGKQYEITTTKWKGPENGTRKV